MSARARVQFAATGFGRNPAKAVTITLDVIVDGLGFNELQYEEAKELLARMAIELTNPAEHEQLARDLSGAAGRAGARAAGKLRRIK